jgi:hypothetical protein
MSRKDGRSQRHPQLFCEEIFSVGREVQMGDAEAGRMSDTSSWHATPVLHVKSA